MEFYKIFPTKLNNSYNLFGEIDFIDDGPLSIKIMVITIISRKIKKNMPYIINTLNSIEDSDKGSKEYILNKSVMELFVNIDLYFSNRNGNYLSDIFMNSTLEVELKKHIELFEYVVSTNNILPIKKLFDKMYKKKKKTTRCHLQVYNLVPHV